MDPEVKFISFVYSPGTKKRLYYQRLTIKYINPTSKNYTNNYTNLILDGQKIVKE